jgi:hypothetical protein
MLINSTFLSCNWIRKSKLYNTPLLQCSRNNTLCACCWCSCQCQSYNNIVRCTKILLWLIYVANNNKTYLGLHVKCPIVVSDFNQLWSFSTHFRKSHQYQISQKYIHWGPCCYVHTYIQTDMTRLVGSFRDYANAPRNLSGLSFLSWHMYLQHESVAVSLNWFHRWHVA